MPCGGKKCLHSDLNTANHTLSLGPNKQSGTIIFVTKYIIQYGVVMNPWSYVNLIRNSKV